MPSSSREGKDLIASILKAWPLRRVLDVGVGAGTYGKMVRNLDLDSDPFIMGVEIFEPYVETYKIHRFYDELWIGDIREFTWEDHDDWDVVIFGDVLEHMTEEDARRVWQKSMKHSTHGVISIPIVPYPQGPSHGNEHERHVATYDINSAMKSFPGSTPTLIGRQIGVLIR